MPESVRDGTGIHAGGNEVGPASDSRYRPVQPSEKRRGRLRGIRKILRKLRRRER